MDILDENQLDLWIEILTEAKQVGYSLSSSPAELLLELMVDCALKLRNQFQEGIGTWALRKNPELKFSQKEVDSLSNPKVLRIQTREPSTFNPQLSLFFEKIAQQMIQVKRLKDLPKDLYSSKGPQGGHQKVDHSVYQYFRRRTLRKK